MQKWTTAMLIQVAVCIAFVTSKILFWRRWLYVSKVSSTKRWIKLKQNVLTRHLLTWEQIFIFLLFFFFNMCCIGVIGWGAVLQARRLWVWFHLGSLRFLIIFIILAALCPRSQLSIWQKWVPGLPAGGKGGQFIGLSILPPFCADCLEILGGSSSCIPYGLSKPLMG